MVIRTSLGVDKIGVQEQLHAQSWFENVEQYGTRS